MVRATAMPCGTTSAGPVASITFLLGWGIGSGGVRLQGVQPRGPVALEEPQVPGGRGERGRFEPADVAPAGHGAPDRPGPLQRWYFVGQCWS
jgi:hypothetical protein